MNQILEDKSIMKNIQILTKYRGFDNHKLVKTDKKRL
jgi:hypothetical protein